MKIKKTRSKIVIAIAPLTIVLAMLTKKIKKARSLIILAMAPLTKVLTMSTNYKKT